MAADLKRKNIRLALILVGLAIGLFLLTFYQYS